MQEVKRVGLGTAFLEAVNTAVARIERFPLSGVATVAGARRVVLRRFPVSVVYRLVGAEMVVLAVAHHARSPGCWAAR